MRFLKELQSPQKQFRFLIRDKNAASAASSLLDGRNSKPLDSSPLNVPSCNLSANDDSADGI